MIPWLELQWPVDPQTYFETTAPLVLEIGFGDGAFLVEEAKANPKHNYLGIEIAWDPIQRLFRRLEREAIGNVRVMRIDGALALQQLLPTSCLKEVFINHPDPWPKERHWSRRLIQKELIADLADCMTPGSPLTIATDHSDYADWIEAVLTSQDRLVTSLPAVKTTVLKDRFVTRYQEKAQALGIGNHFFIYHKADEAAAPRCSQKGGDMPNIALQGQMDLEEIFSHFKACRFQEMHLDVNVVISFVRAYRQTDETHFMVEAMIREGRLSQQVGLLVLQHGNERYTIKASTLGFPKTTWGLKRAVWHLGRFVLAWAPHIEILNTNVGDLLD